MPVTTPTNDNTPNYTFSSTQNGSIIYGGSCNSTSVTANVGSNTVILDSDGAGSILPSGIYSDCTITVTNVGGFSSSPLSILSFTVDTVTPLLSVVTPVISPDYDTTPTFSFSSNEAGIITYGGSCNSATTIAVAGVNTVALDSNGAGGSLSYGTYSDCTITVTDLTSNESEPLAVNIFTIYAIYEHFNDQQFTSPLGVRNNGAPDFNNITYSSTLNRSGLGYAVEATHEGGVDTLATYANLADDLSEGIYFRYWVYYPSSYYFPGEEGKFDNVKLLKFSFLMEADIEFIYKVSTAGGPLNMQLYWCRESTGLCDGGTGVSSVPLPSQLIKDSWHKIEMYLKVPSMGDPVNSVVHVQIDDEDVYSCDDCDIKKTNYTSATQFISIRASNEPSAGHGKWYFDDITAVAGAGDLTNAEPEEPTDLSINAGISYYNITSSAGSNGTISPSGSVSVSSGSNRTFTITPNTGYQISSVAVDGANQGTLSTYTFNNVTANHTISATFTATASQTCTSFIYSSWGSCQSNNTQSRTLVTQLPNNCTGGTPALSQACTYVPTITPPTTTGGGTTTPNPTITPTTPTTSTTQGTLSTSSGTALDKQALIAKIKAQLIELIKQLIQLLQQELARQLLANYFELRN